MCSRLFGWGEPLALSVAGVLSDAKMEGGLVIAAPVYAELLAYPNATESFVNGFLEEQASAWILISTNRSGSSRTSFCALR